MKRIDITKKGAQWVATDDDGEMVAGATTKEMCVEFTAAYAIGLGQPVSVRIHLENGQFEEERTYPRSADPSSSPG